jgi:hypothetical protein
MTESMEFRNPIVVAAMFDRAAEAFGENLVDPVEPVEAAVEAAAPAAPEDPKGEAEGADHG